MIQTTDLRHVDVAILYGLGQKDRAQHVARKLRPPKLLDGYQTGVAIESTHSGYNFGSNVWHGVLDPETGDELGPQMGDS